MQPKRGCCFDATITRLLPQCCIQKDCCLLPRYSHEIVASMETQQDCCLEATTTVEPQRDCCLEATLRCGCMYGIIIDPTTLFWLDRGNNLVLAASRQSARCGTILLWLHKSKYPYLAASRQQTRCGFFEATPSLCLH